MAKKDGDKTDIKGPVITIDFRYWCTQQQRAGDDRKEFATLRQHVKRLKHGEKSPLTTNDIKDVKQLGITLVRRKH